MRAKYLKGWLAAANRKEREEVEAKKKNLTNESTTEGPDGMGG